jgi:uncharacterized membrane protein
MVKIATPRPRPRRTPGITIGVGIGGFVDGIVFHQILQWHDMGSAVLPPVTMAAMRQNMAWDGWFHVVTLLVTVTGIFLLLREATQGRQLPVARGLAGQMLMGWAGFNVVEGIIDHHVLGIHHVMDLPAHDPLLDWLFLALSVLVGIGGWLLATKGDVAARTRLRATDLLVKPVIEPPTPGTR